MTQPPFFYHITTPAHWIKYSEKDYFEADSLATEGFIHASTGPQVQATLNRYYANEPKVFVMKIEAAKLTSELKYELAPSVNDYFPHIYGPLNKDAIVEMAELDAAIDGSYSFTE